MHEAFLKYVEGSSSIPLTNSDIALLKNIFIPKKFRKRQYFLQEGEVCNFGGFIIKGAMRQYSVDDKGTEHIVQLMLENWWIGDRESMAARTPSSYFIDAWEDSDVLLISTNNIPLLRTIPAVAKMGDTISDRHVAAMHKRIHDAISLSAEQRFERLMQTYPEFLQRFPQHIIASYLGITKDTLSRIRHNKATKK